MEKEFQIKAKMANLLIFLQKFENIRRTENFPTFFAYKLFFANRNDSNISENKVFFWRKLVECLRFLRNDFFRSLKLEKFACLPEFVNV
jgi:hypothetical protein